MPYNVYLSYDKTITVESKTYYYFRAVFLPTEFTGSILLYLLKLLGEDITYMFNVATVAPDVIPEDTAVYKIDGTTFVAPTDLYKVCAIDYPFVVTPSIYDFDLDDVFPQNTMVVYSEVPPYSLLPSDLPNEFQTNGAIAVSTSQQTFFPDADDFSQGLIIISSKRSNTPFWTHTYFDRWWAYNGCEYDPEGGHITVKAAYTWTVQFNLDNTIYWSHDGHSFDVTSCNEDVNGAELSYEYDSPIGVLYADVWQSNDVPSEWFHPDFVNQSPSTSPIGGIGGIVALNLLSLFCPAIADRIGKGGFLQ